MGLSITVAVAMLAAVLLSLPVAWVYLLTRAKRGYQQSVVQLLIILPTVVAGIVLLVKYSIALAFSLAGIVAAVRFRNTLDDSKDAVYVFLATAIGLASAVNLPVAAVISIGFNALVLVLWYTDFGSAPVELDGRIAEQRLKRARQLARTGTFVARIDDEVFRNMTREQLEGVAQRAWKRAQATDDSVEPEEVRVRMRTRDLAALRSAVDPRLTENVKNWRIGAINERDGVHTAEYHVQLKKKTTPDELVALIRASGADQLVDRRTALTMHTLIRATVRPRSVSRRARPARGRTRDIVHGRTRARPGGRGEGEERQAQGGEGAEGGEEGPRRSSPPRRRSTSPSR